MTTTIRLHSVRFLSLISFWTLRERVTGEYAFGAQSGTIEGHITTLGAVTAQLIFSFDGQDELDPASGTGVAISSSDHVLAGDMAYHAGDRHEFRWVRDSQGR